VYKYPCDGSLLMPEIPDDEDKSSSPLSQSITPKKRAASPPMEPELIENKRIKK
jgi:hypothetical protein